MTGNKASTSSAFPVRQEWRPVHGAFMNPMLFLLSVVWSVSSAAVDTAAGTPVPADTLPAVDTAHPVETTQPVDTTVEQPADGVSDTVSAAPGDSGVAPVHPPLPVETDSMNKAGVPPNMPDGRTRQSSPGSDTLPIDSMSVPNGSYFSAGIGWSLGAFTLLSLWERALPDSLGSLGLTDTAFGIPFDSTAGPEQPPADTARLFFSVKEKPAIYNMSFPLSLSFVRLRENDRFAFSLSGSWMRKILAATIAASGDTLSRKVDYRESMNVFSVFLSFAYSQRIPPEYLSIADVQRSFFTVGVEISPLIAGTIRREVTAPASDERFGNLKNSISSPQRFLHGGCASLRLGLNLMRRLNRYSATDFGLSFCIQGYGYFLENGHRVAFMDIDPANGKKGRPLYWISNRFELSISLMRLHEK